MDEHLFFPVFLLVFLEEIRAHFESILKVVFFNLFIDAFDQLGFEGLIGFGIFFLGKVFLELFVLFGNGIEILLELGTGEGSELFAVRGYVAAGLFEKR